MINIVIVVGDLPILDFYNRRAGSVLGELQPAPIFFFTESFKWSKIFVYRIIAVQVAFSVICVVVPLLIAGWRWSVVFQDVSRP